MLIAHAAAPQHCKADRYAGKGRAYARAQHAEARNKQGVKQHIKQTHGGIEDAGSDHIAAALQKGGGERIYLRKGQIQRKNQKICRGIGADIRFSAQPCRERPAYQRPENAQQNGNKQGAYKPVLYNGAGAIIPLRAYAVRHLHGKSLPKRHRLRR